MDKALLQMALNALNNSVDVVQNEHARYAEMYQGYPSRKAQINLYQQDYESHKAAIAALELAITQPLSAASEQNLWHQAVLNQCMMVEGCYQESDPAASVKSLIDWHVSNERDSVNFLTDATPSRYALKDQITQTEFTIAPPLVAGDTVTELNFCSRCGKRLGDADDIHTCTPPSQEKQWLVVCRPKVRYADQLPSFIVVVTAENEKQALRKAYQNDKAFIDFDIRYEKTRGKPLTENTTYRVGL